VEPLFLADDGWNGKVLVDGRRLGLVAGGVKVGEGKLGSEKLTGVICYGFWDGELLW